MEDYLIVTMSVIAAVVVLHYSSSFSTFLQKIITKVMRRTMDEMLQYEKNTEEKTRVYTYEKAVERYNTDSHYINLHVCRRFCAHLKLVLKGSI